jgi:L-seryl-tRNA(Ser) seleniumtransferase
LIFVQASTFNEEDGMSKAQLRNLPAVDRLLATPELQDLTVQHSQSLVVEAARAVLGEVRERVLQDDGVPVPDSADLVALVAARVLESVRSTLRPTINATGVIIHTNLGRSPLSDAALAAIQTVASGYSNLEYDLEAGGRGSRYTHAADLLSRLTGAKAALVVNNNAAAVLLILGALAEGREVLISRGQLVEIGGGFRVPEVMEASGARLVEVGTTNRTYIEDYEAAITRETAALLLVHSSNFRMVGFTHEATMAEMAELAHSRGLLALYDLGSGSLLDTASLGAGREPTVQAAVQDGADLVCFSGDKLLGGPQAGLIVGRSDLIQRLARYPLTRALRVGKSTLAALQATLLAYLRGQAVAEIPIWRMIATPLAEVEARAATWAQALRADGVMAQVVPGESTVGGGSLPGESFPSRLLALSVPAPDQVAARLRAGDPPVVARIEGDRLHLDPRTVLPGQDAELLAALRRVLLPR